MTSEILELMSARRNHKGIEEEYKKLNQVINKKCSEAKNRWLAKKYRARKYIQKNMKHLTFKRK